MRSAGVATAPGPTPGWETQELGAVGVRGWGEHLVLGRRDLGGTSLCFGAAASKGEELQPDPGWEALSPFPLPLIKSEVHSGSSLPLCSTQRSGEKGGVVWWLLNLRTCFPLFLICACAGVLGWGGGVEASGSRDVLYNHFLRMLAAQRGCRQGPWTVSCPLWASIYPPVNCVCAPACVGPRSQESRIGF